MTHTVSLATAGYLLMQKEGNNAQISSLLPNIKNSMDQWFWTSGLGAKHAPPGPSI